MSVTLRLPTIPALFDAPEIEEAEGCIQCQMGSKLVPVSYTHLTLPTKRIV